MAAEQQFINKSAEALWNQIAGDNLLSLGRA